MSWIVLIPPDKVGGVMLGVVVDDCGVACAGRSATEFESRGEAEKYARQFRCGIVAEAEKPLRLTISRDLESGD